MSTRAQQATLLAPQSFETPESPISTRLSARRDFADGVGYTSGYSYLEGFIPLRQGDGTITFANVRVLNFDHSQYWEAQGGGGARWVVPNTCVIAGLNAFYDGRNTGPHWYSQLGFGWELLSCCWEARGNVYVPVGQQRFLVGDGGFFNPRFVRTNIAVNRTLTYESSAGGADVEVGRQLPQLFGNVRTSAYVGYYHYSNDNIQTANGIRGRIESWFGENLSLHAQVQNDGVYDTTVTGGLALHFGGVARGARRDDPLYAKLGSRVVRDPNVVLQQRAETSDELLIDPATGKPFEVRHANSFAAAGGDGSVERPFQNLTQLQAGSGQNQILFLHAGSVFNAQNLVLQNNQRLLGEGINHIVVATQGAFLLPRATTGTALPIIQNSLGYAAITIAGNTEVSGLQILSPLNNGIYGSGAANVNIHRNIIRDMQTPDGQESSPYGINLVSASGNIEICDNVISSTLFNIPTAIYTDFSGSSRASLHIANNSVASSFLMDGIVVGLFDSSVVRGQILGNNVASAFSGSAGLYLQTFDSASGVFQIARNTFLNSDATLNSLDGSVLNVQYAFNASDNYALDQFGLSSTLRAEDLLGTNTGVLSSFTGTLVPAGTYFPVP